MASKFRRNAFFWVKVSAQQMAKRIAFTHTYSERDALSVENRFRIFGAGSKPSLPSSKTILLRTNLKCFQKPSKELTEMHVVSFIRCSIMKISVVYVLKRNFDKRISQ